MGQETVTYLTNVIISVILAGLLTHSWMSGRRSRALGFWALGAWTLATAAVLFALRPDLPVWFGRFGPTLLVTVGQAALYLGARATAQRTLPWTAMGVVVATHAAILVYFLSLDQPTHWRMVTNGVIWAGLSFASFAALREAPVYFWKPLFAPANVFLVHGAFHVLRVVLAIASAANGWTAVADALQLFGDLEATFFTVALFVSLLIATLQLRHEELSSARAEVETLSGLLPICAWCKKVRDDEGYWRQVEDYFERRGRIRFTHGICAECANDFRQEAAEARAPGPR